MKQFLIASCIALLLTGAFSGAALANQNGASTVAVSSSESRPVATVAPLVDVLEDEGQKLTLIGLPASNGAGLDVTLVYQDEERKEMTSVTVNPELAYTSQAEVFNGFLETMDPAFLSFVKASLADKFLHMQSALSAFDRAQSSIFFPRKRTAVAQVVQEEIIPIAE